MLGTSFQTKRCKKPGDSNAWSGTGAGTNSKDQLEIEIEVHDSIHYIPIWTTYSNQPSTKARCFAFDQPFQSSNPSIPDCHNEWYWYEVEYVQRNLPYPNQCWRYPALSHLEIGDNRSAKIQSIIFRTNNFNFAVDRHIQCLGKLTFPLSTSFFGFQSLWTSASDDLSQSSRSDGTSPPVKVVLTIMKRHHSTLTSLHHY